MENGRFLDVTSKKMRICPMKDEDSDILKMMERKVDVYMC